MLTTSARPTISAFQDILRVDGKHLRVVSVNHSDRNGRRMTPCFACGDTLDTVGANQQVKPGRGVEGKCEAVAADLMALPSQSGIDGVCKLAGEQSRIGPALSCTNLQLLHDGHILHGSNLGLTVDRHRRNSNKLRIMAPNPKFIADLLHR